MIAWYNLNLGDEAAEAAAAAVKNRNISMGRLCEEFETRMKGILGVRHVVAAANGTSALTMALLEAGIRPGDEVIVPDVTWIATAHAAFLLGAKVCPVDIDSDSPVIPVGNIEKAITAKTRAVIPVHLNGRFCNMPEIMKLADKHGIIVIEDVAQSLFCQAPDGRYMGTFGRCGCFSMSMTKLISCGQGGFIITDDDSVADRLRKIRTHGVNDTMQPGWIIPGGNFRFTDIHAAIALTQLAKRRQRIDGTLRTYSQYAEKIVDSPIFTMYRPKDPQKQVPLYIEAQTPLRSDLVRFLKERDIQVREMYAGLHTAAYFQQQSGCFPNSVKYAGETLWLPFGPERTEEELDHVSSVVGEWVERNAG